jgi:hypothetical protein
MRLRLSITLRNGRKVPRALYRQLGDAASDEDPLIGMVDSPLLAALVVVAVNALPECVTACEHGCPDGPAHCMWLHEEPPLPGWHAREDCPFSWRAAGDVA